MKLQPPIWPIEDIRFPAFRKIYLENGIPLYLVSGATEPVFKLDLQFKTGRWYERQPGTAQAMLHLIGEGSRASKEPFVEAIEYFGAQHYHEAGVDFGTVTLVGLNKHAPGLIPMLAEVLLSPEFPDEDLQDFKQQNLEDYRISERNNAFVADQKFREICFGPGHPYGPDPSPAEINALTVPALQSHHQDTIHAGSCTIFLSGSIGDDLVETVAKYFGNGNFQSGVLTSEPNHFTEYKPQKIRMKGFGKQQASIIIGCPVIDRSHPDFRPLYMLHTVLGGFFGSRLMRNLREEKGLTYHIGSALENYMHGSIMEISTEVNAKTTERCIVEIHSEFERLRNELIGQSELLLLRSYITGSLLAQWDGPLQTAEYLKQHVSGEAPDIDIEEDVRLYREVDAEEIRRAAGVYLEAESLSEVVVK